MSAFIRLVLCFSLIGLTHAIGVADDSGQRARTFIRALELFDAAKSPEDYREPAQLWESLLSDGYQNGVVYYNLANAYYRSGQFGRAILNYRKAKVFRPRDTYLEANLQQAIARAPGRLVEQSPPWWKHVLFWSDWIGQSAKVMIATIGLCSASVVFLLASIFRRPRLYGIALLLGLGFGAIFIDACLHVPEVTGSVRAVVVTETIARKGTGDNYDPAFDKPLQDGAEFQVISETPNWTLGHFEGIGDGWVRNECIAK